MKNSRTNPKRLKLLILITICFLIFFLNANNTLAYFKVSTGDWLSYNVVSASDTINDFYGVFPPGTYYGAWSVIVEDNVIFNITSVEDGVINGTLFLGNEIENITFYDVRNIDTAFGFGLGINPWNGGFLANSTDWNNIIESIEGTNTTVTYIDDYNHTYKGEQEVYSVVHFNTTNYYGQYSSLIYHRSSGVLLKAFSSFGLYELEISLNTSNLELEVYTETVTTDLLVVLVPFLAIAVTYNLMKKKS